MDIVHANAFQALIGALYVDQGDQAARALTMAIIAPKLRFLDINEFLHLSYPRTTLARILKSQSRPPLKFRFEVRVYA